MKKQSIFIAIVFLVIIGLGLGYYFGYDHGFEKNEPVQPELVKTYSNEKYGIQFSYPEGYILEEGERGNGHRGQYVITLIREEDSEPRINGEGPTSISIAIYQNNLDKQTLVNWLNNSNNSNYKLSSQPYASTTVDGVEAISYTWSRLYEGETVSFLHKENILSITVTFITPEDESVKTYREILKSVKLI